MATQRSTHNPADASFFHFLAVIRKKLSRSRSQPKSRSRGSSADEIEFCYEMQGNTGDKSALPLRRARSSDTPMLGILKTRPIEEEDSGKCLFRRVSFCSSRDGIVNNHVTRCGKSSMLHESTAHPSVSLKNSPNWPPPPPPRQNSIDSPNWPPPPPPRRNPIAHTRTRQDKDLSKVLKSDLVKILPFPIDSARTLSRPFHHHLPEVNDSGNTSVRAPPPPPS